MKKMVLLMSLMAGLLVSVMSFSSCSSDSDSAPVNINVDDIVGTWVCTKSTDVVNGEAIDGYMVGKYLQINEGGTYTSDSGTMGSGIWVLNGNNITVKNTNNSVTINATVSLSGGTLRLKGISQGISFDYTFKQTFE